MECCPSTISIGEISPPQIRESLEEESKLRDTGGNQEHGKDSGAGHKLAKEQDKEEESDEDDSQNVYVELPALSLPQTPVLKVIPPSPKPHQMRSTRESPKNVWSPPQEESHLAVSAPPPHQEKFSESSGLPVTRHRHQVLQPSLSVPIQDDPEYLYEELDWTTPVSNM